MLAGPKSEEYRETLDYKTRMENELVGQPTWSVVKDLKVPSSVYQSHLGLSPKNGLPK